MKYKITCKKCNKEATVNIAQVPHMPPQVQYDGGMPTNLLAGRFRTDMQWGWECTCGNDSRLAPSEKDQAKTLVSGTPQKIQEIIAGLKIPDEKKFLMSEVR